LHRRHAFSGGTPPLKHAHISEDGNSLHTIICLHDRQRITQAMDYEEEEDGLFGSDVEDINPAAPIVQKSRTITSPGPSPVATVYPIATSATRVGSIAGPSRPGLTGSDRRYAQDDINTRMEMLRQKKGEGLVRERRVRGARSLRSCCMDGRSAARLVADSSGQRMLG